ncbi:transposase [Micromonospora sp. BQ11]|uniref:transposase n=1 Tax=Micromonospora sp. BQ11 TaxID=3452212 RepID=UPI003F8BD9F3
MELHQENFAMMDLPQCWCDDPQRRAEAGIPEQVRFATKPQLAVRMIEAAVTGGLPCRWGAGDEAYGNDPAWPSGSVRCAWVTSWPWPAHIR